MLWTDSSGCVLCERITMLAKILSNFSEDELLSFLPKESLNFAINADSKVQELNKYKLAAVIASTKKADFY